MRLVFKVLDTGLSESVKGAEQAGRTMVEIVVQRWQAQDDMKDLDTVSAIGGGEFTFVPHLTFFLLARYVFVSRGA